MATPIDLSQLPFPGVVETIDFETIYARRKERFLSLVPAEERADYAAALELESEPLTMLLQDASYLEVIMRQRINDAARANMLAFALDGDLDNLVALLGVQRLVVTPADPENDVAEVKEGNADLRKRAQLAPLGFSVAGPSDAYKYHALSADANVRDVSVASPVFSKLQLAPEVAALLPAGAIVLKCDDDAGLPDPMPGMVAINVLARAGDGTAAQPLLDKVATTLSASTVRPLTDEVRVQSAGVLPFAIRATLFMLPGPDRALVMAEALRRVQAYVEECREIGREVAVSGIMAALHITGVERVQLDEPLADIATSSHQAPYCSAIELVQG